MTSNAGPMPPAEPLGPQELEPLPQQILDDEVKVALDDPANHVELSDGKGEPTIIRSKYADWGRRQIIRKFWRMYLIGLLVSTAGIFAGYCDAAHGNVIANKGFIKQFGTVYNAKGELELNAQYVSWWGITLQTSTLIPQVFTAVITDRFGRRVGCWMYLLGVCVGIIIETFARDWKGWLGAKFMCGWAYGHIQGGPLTLMSELVMPQMRGNVLACFAFNWTLGGLFCAIGLNILQSTSHPEQYLHIIYSEWLIVFLFGIACLVMPESPIFLIKRGKIDAAKKHYRRVIGKMDDFDFDHEFAVLVQEVEHSRRLTDAQSKSEWLAVLKWRNLRRCLIPVLPYAGQSLTGATYLNSYTSYFFQLAGLKNPFLATVITSLVGCAGVLSAMFLYDRIGRRPLMVYGTIGCCIFNFCVGAIAFKPIDEAVGAGLITAAAAFVFTNNISYNAVGWTAQVEISTPLLRAKSAGICALFHGFSKVLWYWTVPYMLSDQKAGWGAKCGLFFGGLCVIWFIPVYFYFPETSKRNFAALDNLFDRRISERRFHLTETPYDSPEFVEDLERRKAKGSLVKRLFRSGEA